MLTVEVIERIGFNGSLDHVCRSVGREADPTNLPLRLQLPHRLDQVAFLSVVEQPLVMIIGIEPMHAEQVDVVQSQRI